MAKRILFMLVLIGMILISSMARADTITLTFTEGFPPFAYKKDGRVVGIQIDLAVEVLRKLDVEVNARAYPWSRAQALVEDGKADGFVTIPTDKRGRYAKFSRLPLFTSDFEMYTGAGNPRIEEFKMIRTLDQLRTVDIRHISFSESGWHLHNLKGAVGFLKQVKTSKQIILMLDRNRVDVYIEQPRFWWEVKKMGMEKRIVKIPNVLDTTFWHLIIGKKSPFVRILPKIDVLMERMDKDGSLGKLREKVFRRYDFEWVSQ